MNVSHYIKLGVGIALLSIGNLAQANVLSQHQCIVKSLNGKDLFSATESGKVQRLKKNQVINFKSTITAHSQASIDCGVCKMELKPGSVVGVFQNSKSVCGKVNRLDNLKRTHKMRNVPTEKLVKTGKMVPANTVGTVGNAAANTAGTIGNAASGLASTAGGIAGGLGAAIGSSSALFIGAAAIGGGLLINEVVNNDDDDDDNSNTAVSATP